jgi:hypothetical protein
MLRSVTKPVEDMDLHLCLISFGSADIGRCIISYGLGFFLLGNGNCAASLLFVGLRALDSSYASGEGAVAG